MKIKKTKKAANGLQDVAVPEQGSYSNVASSASTFASAGAQFGPWGAAAGGLAGFGLGLLQKSQQDDASNAASLANRSAKVNRAYAGNDQTINQGMQRFNKGGKVKIKVIEIEGKKTPEIHTDKNFNVKNLGTTPHSMGGDKVHAEEGDIVFNTQNSLTKFNKIANAIQSGDKTTLNKEKDKLPEDTSDKKQRGGKDILMSAEEDALNRGVGNPNYKVRTKASTNSKRPVTPARFNNTRGNQGEMKPIPGASESKRPYVESNTSKPWNDLSYSMYSPNKPLQAIPRANVSTNTKNPNATSTGSVNRGKRTVNTIPAKSATQPMAFNPNFGDLPDLSPLKGVQSSDQKAKTNAANFIGPMNGVNPDSNSAAKIGGNKTNQQSSNSNNSKLNNALQFAGVANNLFQGLKKEHDLDQHYITPEKLQYKDRSQNLRSQSSGAVAIQDANARNLSGGNVGNLRANMAASQAANIDRQGTIDEREQARADAIQAQNTQAQNQANEVNAQRRDNYQQIMMGNRAAKEAFIGQAASDISTYGAVKQREAYARSRDDKAQAAQMAGLNALNGSSKFTFDTSGNRTFNTDAGNTVLGGGGYGLGRRLKQPKNTLSGNLDGNIKDDEDIQTNAKGNKGVKIKTKQKKNAKYI